MNRTYRSIWNDSLGAWVAASEITSAGGKRSSGSRRTGSSRRSSARFVLRMTAAIAMGMPFFLAGGGAWAQTSGGLQLCTSGGGTATGRSYGADNGASYTGTVGNCVYRSTSYTFLLGNGSTLNGGSAPSYSTAAVYGDATGKLFLYGSNGIQVEGATTFLNSVAMSGNKITGLRAFAPCQLGGQCENSSVPRI